MSVSLYNVPFHLKAFCYQGGLPLQRSCIRSCAMAPLLGLADLLRRDPRLFRVDKTSIRLEEKPMYLGIYFNFLCGSLTIRSHSAVGHWMFPARQPLTNAQERAVLQRFRDFCDMEWQFAQTPPLVLGSRAIVTIHVQITANQRWWGIQQSARDQLHVSENPGKRCVNFHVSMDVLGLPVRAPPPRFLSPPPPPPPTSAPSAEAGLVNGARSVPAAAAAAASTVVVAAAAEASTVGHPSEMAGSVPAVAAAAAAIVAAALLPVIAVDDGVVADATAPSLAVALAAAAAAVAVTAAIAVVGIVVIAPAASRPGHHRSDDHVGLRSPRDHPQEPR